MKHLNVGSLKIPATEATKSSAILAKRGAGKTYTAAVFAEEYAKAGIPFVVFDPIDVWWGLRLAADGKTKGLPVVVFGLEHADILITKDDGPKIARAIVKENISCVISTFGMSKTAMRHIIAEFSEELLKINDTPRKVLIEEAHEFVPQRVQSGAGKCFSAVEALVVMGRNRGIGVTLINQRAATINKDVLTQVDNLIAMRSVGPQDRKALSEWVEFHSAEGDFKQFINSLPSLPTGEAWFWSPEFMGIFERIQIRKRTTFHPDREKLGQNFKIPKISQTDIQGFIEGFTAKQKPQERVSVNPTRLTTTVTEREKMLTKDNTLLMAQLDTERTVLAEWQAYSKLLEDRINNMVQSVLEMGKSAPMIFLERPTGKPTKTKHQFAASPIQTIQTTPKEVVSGEEIKLGAAERKVYSFLYANEGKSFTKLQVAVVCGYSPKSGSFQNGLYRLNALGLTKKDGEKLTVAVMVPDLYTEGEQYNPDIWYSKLPKAEREVLKFLRDNPVGKFTKESIAEYVGYSVLSGSFQNGLYHLNSLGLTIKDGPTIQINHDLLNL